MSDVLVLCYHALSPSWDADLSTTPELFERQLALLAERGYRGVTFSEAVAAGAGAGGGVRDVGAGRAGGVRKPSGVRLAAITFDDAFRSVLELARPILDRHGFTATVFAPTDYMGGERLRWQGIEQWLGGEHEAELEPMTWEELRSLADAGWEIGSHTRSHPHLTQIGDEALARELAESKATCEERLGRPCPTLAYPYGDHDDRVVRATAKAGYEAAAALPDRLQGHDPLAYPRVGVYRVDDNRRFRLKVSPGLRRLRGSRAWDALAAIRGAGK
ncbi:MAG TPA: polysaccharide deacetylase family protein [Solirubrobacteraceae bacterium]|nr:polysaccharide deacetylase family protein [Solirubrobacteraceae bacterium]